MPHESMTYIADSANAPYGPKGRKEIQRLSQQHAQWLLEDKNCKALVVACNTATTNAIQDLRATYQVPIIGIEPAIKPAAISTKTGAIGILATAGTLSSELFSRTSQAYASDINVVEVVGAGLVEYIESGQLNSPHLKDLLHELIRPMIFSDIDHLVLGCTHYPLLIPLLREVLPPHVDIIDSGAAVARQLQARLTEVDLLASTDAVPQYELYSSSNLAILKFFVPDLPGCTVSELPY